MKRERRKLTRRELASITSTWPVVRKIPAPTDTDKTGRRGHATDRAEGRPDRSGAEK